MLELIIYVCIGGVCTGYLYASEEAERAKKEVLESAWTVIFFWPLIMALGLGSAIAISIKKKSKDADGPR